jgi:hypothetical protein
MVAPRTLTHLIEVNSTPWSSETAGHGASPPHASPPGLGTTANTILTVTPVDPQVSSASNPRSSLRSAGLFAPAGCGHGWHAEVSGGQAGAHASGAEVCSARAVPHGLILCLAPPSPGHPMG